MKKWTPWMILAVFTLFAGWRQCNSNTQCRCAELGHASAGDR